MQSVPTAASSGRVRDSLLAVALRAHAAGKLIDEAGGGGDGAWHDGAGISALLPVSMLEVLDGARPAAATKARSRSSRQIQPVGSRWGVRGLRGMLGIVDSDRDRDGDGDGDRDRDGNTAKGEGLEDDGLTDATGVRYDSESKVAAPDAWTPLAHASVVACLRGRGRHAEAAAAALGHDAVEALVEHLLQDGPSGLRYGLAQGTVDRTALDALAAPSMDAWEQLLRAVETAWGEASGGAGAVLGETGS